MKLSILICTTETRHDTFFPRIFKEIRRQVEQLPGEMNGQVQYLWLGDNKKMTVGAKRNALINAAQGKYVVFVDDDDWIEPNYVEMLTRYTDTDADVITFDVEVSINGGLSKLCEYSIRFEDKNYPDRYERIPNHIMCIKKEIAAGVGFKDMTFGEDFDFSARLKKVAKSEAIIGKILYHYKFSDATTETR